MEHEDTIKEESHDEGPMFNENMNHDDDGSTDGGGKSLPSDHEESEDESSDDELDENENDDTSVVEEDGDAAPERTGRSPRLREKDRVDYANLHRFGETQLLQQHKVLSKKIIRESGAKAKDKSLKRSLKIKTKDTFRKVIGIVMAHLAKREYDDVNMKEGLARFGEKAVEAVLKEFAQLDDSESFEPIHAHLLTREQKGAALSLITLVKKKRCGRIKGRAYADGRKQRKYIKKEEAAAPTLQLESLFLSLMIDANERRDVATCDIVGAYLMADMPDFVLVRLVNESVDIMCKANKRYKNFVTIERGKRVLYVKLKKALYRCIKSALLWYETRKTYLEDIGFFLNRYDPCVANKTIDGSQCTICWYVDDIKISHKNPQVVSNTIACIEQKFGKMKVRRGCKHEFVGMKIKFTDDGKIAVTMDDCIQDCFEVFGDGLEGRAVNSAKGNLFNDDEDDEQKRSLDDDRSDIFHHIVAKLLFVAKRSRIDIDLAISYLCTRVSNPTEGDWAKLKRVLLI